MILSVMLLRQFDRADDLGAIPRLLPSLTGARWMDAVVTQQKFRNDSDVTPRSGKMPSEDHVPE